MHWGQFKNGLIIYKPEESLLTKQSFKYNQTSLRQDNNESNF